MELESTNVAPAGLGKFGNPPGVFAATNSVDKAGTVVDATLLEAELEEIARKYSVCAVTNTGVVRLCETYPIEVGAKSDVSPSLAPTNPVPFMAYIPSIYEELPIDTMNIPIVCIVPDVLDITFTYLLPFTPICELVEPNEFVSANIRDPETGASPYPISPDAGSYVSVCGNDIFRMGLTYNALPTLLSNTTPDALRIIELMFCDVCPARLPIAILLTPCPRFPASLPIAIAF